MLGRIGAGNGAAVSQWYLCERACTDSGMKRAVQSMRTAGYGQLLKSALGPLHCWAE